MRQKSGDDFNRPHQRSCIDLGFVADITRLALQKRAIRDLPFHIRQIVTRIHIAPRLRFQQRVQNLGHTGLEFDGVTGKRLAAANAMAAGLTSSTAIQRNICSNFRRANRRIAPMRSRQIKHYPGIIHGDRG